MDENGRPLVLLLTEGQMNDHKGAKLLFGALPPAPVLITNKGYDSDEFRVALVERATIPCIPPKKTRKTQHTAL